MDNKHYMKEQNWDQIVDLMEEGQLLSDDELALLEQDEEAMRTIRDLHLCKNAMMRQYDEDAPDIENEWKAFCEKGIFSEPTPTKSEKKEKNRFLWGALTGIAASLLVLLLFAWWTNYPLIHQDLVVFQAIDSVQQITLQTSSGDRIDIKKDTRQEIMESVGTLLSKKDTFELAYIAKENPDAYNDKIETHRLSTPRGKDFKMTLEDGTTIWMNAESCLEYPSQFTGKERVVHLKGEAYFKVAKNPEFPFVICTDRMQIRVLGTELNVRNYISQDSHVTLINGSVEVSDNKNNKNLVRLTPGEDALLDENNSFVIKEVDTDSYTYWRDGYFYFDNTPLKEVVQELGRWYNINIVFENEKLMDLHIRYFCVRSETLERAISLLNRMKKIHATLSGNTIYIR